MKKHRVTTYHTDILLVTVDAAAAKTLHTNNDFYFFANAFSATGPINGKMRGSSGGNALTLSPLMLNTKLYKHQMFKGSLSIINHSTAGELFVELLRVTPIVEVEKEFKE